MVYSEKKSKEANIGWHRGGSNIFFERNGFHSIRKDYMRYYSSLIIEYEFEYDSDEVYFANTIPYTYSTLNKELNEFEKDDKRYKYKILSNLVTLIEKLFVLLLQEMFLTT